MIINICQATSYDKKSYLTKIRSANIRSMFTKMRIDANCTIVQWPQSTMYNVLAAHPNFSASHPISRLDTQISRLGTQISRLGTQISRLGTPSFSYGHPVSSLLTQFLRSSPNFFAPQPQNHQRSGNVVMESATS